MPGPFQWEATFSRTYQRCTAQAIETTRTTKKGSNRFLSLLTELKQEIKDLF